MSKKTIIILVVAIVIFIAGVVAGNWAVSGAGVLGALSQLIFNRKPITPVTPSAEQHVADATGKTDSDVGSMDTVVQAGGSLVEQSEELVREFKEQSARTSK